jgi:hypothetical protein
MARALAALRRRRVEYEGGRRSEGGWRRRGRAGRRREVAVVVDVERRARASE